MMARWLLMVSLFFACALPAQAHKASDSYLSLSVQNERIEGQWDIALRDLEMAVGLDANGDAAISWDELRARHAAIAAYALARLKLSSDGAACPLRVAAHLVDRHTDGAYAVMRLQGACPQAVTALRVDYKLLFDIDPQHKGLLRLTHRARRPQPAAAAGRTIALAPVRRLRAPRRLAYLDRLRPHPVPGVAAAACGTGAPRRPLAGT
jgi:hypothetical protein